MYLYIQIKSILNLESEHILLSFVTPKKNTITL
jgi:hypothetical protein